MREDVEPQADGGLRLLREVLGRAHYNSPKYVIGLTALPDVYQSAAAEFEEDLWSLVLFDAASYEWLGRIERKILHIASLNKAPNGEAEFETDVLVVAALQDELDPLLSNSWNWQLHDVVGDAAIYYEAKLVDSGSKSFRVVAARLPMMGMAAAASLTMKAGITFKPKTIMMIGICAGDSTESQFGDVIVGSPVWDYGNGKHFDRSSDRKPFEPAIYQVNITAEMRGLIERLSQNRALLSGIHDSFSGTKPRAAPKIIFGPLASGAAVVADRDKFKQIQSEQHRKLLGIEMEAYGVMFAAQELPHPKPQTLVAKSVQDYADEEKDDRFRPYACFTSAMVAAAAIDELRNT